MSTSSENNVKRRVGVIGGGLGGLSCAIRLAHEGFAVTLFEKNEHVGGKMDWLEKEGFVWDTGPTMLVRADLFDELWRSVGRKIEDDLDLQPFDPVCRHRWHDGTVIDENAAFWRKNEIASFLQYLTEMEKILGGIPGENLVSTWKRRIGWNYSLLLKFLPKILTRESMHDVSLKSFSDPHLVQLFDRLALCTGSSPLRTPPVFHLLALERARMSAKYAKGGTRQVVDALVKLAVSLGVVIQTKSEVTGWAWCNNAHKIAIEGRWFDFDFVVCNADALLAYQTLLPRKLGGEFRDAYLSRRGLSASAFILCLGVDKKYEGLAYQNVFYPADLELEYKQLFVERKPVDHPSIALTVSCLANFDLAPPGCENWVVSVAAPTQRSSISWAKIGPGYADHLIELLESFGFPDLRSHIVAREFITPSDFRKRYLTFGGNIYGFASHGLKSLFYRPPMTVEELPRFYFVGGSVQPGCGMERVLEGAKRATERICLERDLA